MKVNYETFECHLHAHPAHYVNITAGVLWAVLGGYITGNIETTLLDGRPLVRVQRGAKYLPSLQNV